MLVVLSGEHDLTSAEELRQTFDQSLGRCDHLIVDLSAAEFIDSTTIRVLMGTRQHAIERDRKFSVVLGTAPIVERVLEISGLLTLLDVVPTVERALACVAQEFGTAPRRDERDGGGRCDGTLGHGRGPARRRGARTACGRARRRPGAERSASRASWLEHVPGVPAEIVAGRGVKVDGAEASGARNAVPVVRP